MMLMTFFYTIFIPILILVFNYFIERKPNDIKGVVDLLFKTFKDFIFYALLLYYIGGEHFLNVGLSFLTVIMFAIPLGIIAIPLKLYYFFKKEK